MQFEIEEEDILLNTEAINLHFDTKGALYIAEKECTTIIKHRTCQRPNTIKFTTRSSLVDIQKLMKQMTLIGQPRPQIRNDGS